MKISLAQLESSGLVHGQALQIPACFKRYIAHLFSDGQSVTAIILARNFKDYAIYQLAFRLLNQLYRYYRQPIVIYCLSYQWLATGQKNYLTFKSGGQVHSSHI